MEAVDRRARAGSVPWNWGLRWRPPAVANPVVLLALACAVLLTTVGGLLFASLVQELRAVADGVYPASGHYDFLAFYSAGHFVWLGRVADLYLHPSALADYQHTLVAQDVGAAGYMPFLYPPFAAVLQAPLALVPEPVARLAWFGLNSLLAIGIAVYLTRHVAGRWRVAAPLALLATYPVYQALVEGQWSFVLLLGTLAGLHLARRGRYGWAGAALSVLWLKPQLAVIVLTALLLLRHWRMAAGMVGATALVTLVTLPVAGIRAYTAYVPFLVNVSLGHLNGGVAVHPGAWEGDLALVQGLNGIVWGYIAGAPSLLVDALWLLGVVATALLLRRALRRIRPGFDDPAGALMLATLTAVVLLFDPHLWAQDIVLLFVIVPVLAPWLLAPFGIIVVAALAVIADAPLLDNAVPLHLFTVVIWLAVVAVGLLAARETSPALRSLRGYVLADPPAARPAVVDLYPAGDSLGLGAGRQTTWQRPATARSRPGVQRSPVPPRTIPLPEKPG